MTKLAEHFAGIAAAASVEALEHRLQEAYCAPGFSRRTKDRICRAVRNRGGALCAASPLSHLLPRLKPRRRLVLCGDSYSVGYGRNSTGERYVWRFAEEWALKKWKDAGIPQDEAKRAWDWWMCGYPHRALEIAEGWPAQADAGVSAPREEVRHAG